MKNWSENLAKGKVDTFIAECQQPDGQIVIPTGAHLIDFWKGERRRHLPHRIADD